MSFEAICWALSQVVDKSSSKFVLVAMADCVNADGIEQMVCWPSCAHLAQLTGQDIKTVEAGLRRLRDAGFIVDTGSRKGATNQVIVYQLNTPEFGGVYGLPKIDESALKTPVFGAVETGGKTPVFPAKTPVFPVKDPQISRQRPPKTGDGTSNGTSNGTKKEPVSVTHIDGVSDELLSDYMKVRIAKKAGPLTKTAIAGLEREGAKAGLTLAETMTYCCEAGWQCFNFGWYANRTQNANPGKQPISFKQADAEAGMARWEQMTGRIHPDRGQQAGNVIDITPTTLEIAR